MLGPDDRNENMMVPFAGFRARWRSWSATPLGANVSAVGEALLYLALIALVAWLWGTPEADFRYWGF